MMRLRSLFALALFPTIAACGGGEQTSAPPPQTPPAPPPAASAAPTPAGTTTASNATDPHQLLVVTASCWYGGLWGDALGEPAGDARKAGTEARCNDALRRVYGAEDATHSEKLRALDVTAVDDVASKLAASPDDVKALRALADAQREAMDARRAADRVKKDISGDREPEKLSSDEVGAVAPLKATKALEALAKLDVKDLARDAHALSLLTAMDRVESSRGLPKHLKIYAMEGAFALLFNAPIPPLPEDATKRIPRGAYLAYVTDVAKAAGHPIPDSAKTPKEREALGWAGVIEGIADKMKADVGQLKIKELDDVLARTEHRLEAEYNAEKNAAATLNAPPAPPIGATKPNGPPAAPPKPGPKK